MPDFRMTASPMPEVTRAVEIQLTGDVTSANVPKFQEDVAVLLKPAIVIPVFLMKDAGFISSAGFAYLMELARSIAKHGGVLVMVEPPPKIRVIMETLGIERLFDIVGDVQAARALAAQHLAKLLKAPRLVEILGAKEGAEYPILANNITIGSDPDSTIVLKHHQVERHHAEVFRTGDQCYLKDLGTKFGTYVGKKKVAESPLAHGDVITIATFRYAFVPAGGTLHLNIPQRAF